MKRNLITALIALLGLGVQARVWSLQECIDYAIDHNLTVEQQNIERLSAEQSVTEAKDAVLPDVSAGVSQNWNFGRGLTADNTYADRNTSNFGLQAGLSLPLFNGLQTVRNVQYAKASLSAIVEGVEAAKDDVTLRVMAQYLQALYCGELEGVAQSQAELTTEELEKRKALLEAGKIPEADMLDARSQAAQARLQLVSAQNDRRLALLDLQQLLRLPVSDDFEVQALEGDEPPMLLDPQTVYENALGYNHGILASELRVKAADRQISLAKTGWIPKLSFNAGLSDNYYKIGGMSNENFRDQMRHNFSQYVGFSLSIPIFDGLSTRNNVRRARINRLNEELAFETRKDNLYKSIYETYYQAVSARERFAAASEAATAGAASLNAVQEKYSLGRATPVDFDNARTQFFQAMSERARARYEMILRAGILEFYGNPSPRR